MWADTEVSWFATAELAFMVCLSQHQDQCYAVFFTYKKKLNDKNSLK